MVSVSVSASLHHRAGSGRRPATYARLARAAVHFALNVNSPVLHRITLLLRRRRRRCYCCCCHRRHHGCFFTDSAQ
jgi:hypothetical protein